MFLALTLADQMFLAELLKRGALRYVDKSSFPSRAFVFFCGDGDRFEQLEYLSRLMRGADQTRVIALHSFSWKGGPLLIAPSFGDVVGREFALSQLLAAVALKPHIDAVILQPHAVCGAALARGIDSRGTLALLVEAMKELAKFIEEHAIETITRIVCTFHVDYGQGRMKTYSFQSGQL